MKIAATSYDTMLFSMTNSAQKKQNPEDDITNSISLGSDTLTMSQGSASAAAPSNMMSGNFAGATSPSRYIEATKASLQAEQQMAL